MRLKLLTLVLFGIFTNKLLGQSYNTVFGLRFGDNFGFTASQRIANHTTIEANASDGLFSQSKYLSLSVKQHYAMMTRRINFFIGVGCFGRSSIIEGVENPDFVFKNHGISGLLGAEMTLGRINLSIDYSPQYIMNKNYSGRKLSVDSALSVRYVLWKRKGSIRKFFEKIF